MSTDDYAAEEEAAIARRERFQRAEAAAVAARAATDEAFRLQERAEEELDAARAALEEHDELDRPPIPSRRERERRERAFLEARAAVIAFGGQPTPVGGGR